MVATMTPKLTEEGLAGAQKLGKGSLGKQLNEVYASGAKALEAGKSMISAHNSGANVAAAAQALANQTGGNIMGFTYE